MTVENATHNAAGDGGPPVAVFDWTNEAWAGRYLPAARLASVALQNDQRHTPAGMSETDAGDLVELFAATAGELLALAALCDRAADHVANAWAAAHPGGGGTGAPAEAG